MESNWGGNTTLKNRITKSYASVEFKPNRALVFMHSPISEHGTSLLSEFSKSNRMTYILIIIHQKESICSH